MTPQEAVDKVVANDIVHANRVQSLVTLRELIDACVATAKAEAKADETQQCVGIAAAHCLAMGCDDSDGTAADAILRASGLEVKP